MKFILKQKPIFIAVTKEVFRVFEIMVLSFILVSATIIIKYKPVYEVKAKGNTLGYIQNVDNFKERIKKEIIEKEEQNIDSISLEEEPQYIFKLVEREKEVNEDTIIAKLDETSITTYKYYAITLNNETEAFADTLAEAEKVVEEIKSEYEDKDIEIELSLEEKYTQNLAEVKMESVEDIEQTMESQINDLLEEEEAKKAIATVNGINFAVLPVSGKISSRFGAVSSIRSSAHTGLDIACSQGTDIKVVAKGEVVCASYNGSYGNLIKVDHGNGVETWYAHCSKINVKVGQKVEAQDVIGKVGSTGNSTGPHLHLEIRINGKAINPQNYIYN